MVLYDPEGNFLVGSPIPLGTREGRHIPNERRLQRPPAAMMVARDLVVSNHASARMRSLSSVYNCMGMVFATRRTCIEPDYLEMILQDDGYRSVSDESELWPGDIVIYRDQEGEVAHIGIVIRVTADLRNATWEVFAISQWGADGEYLHRVDDVNPRLGSPVEYWTERS